jgi:hypothetical protein
MIDVAGKPILPLCPRYMLACANEKARAACA